MSEGHRGLLAVACGWILWMGGTASSGASQAVELKGLPVEEKRTEEFTVEHVEAKNGLGVLRTLAGTREVEVRDSRTLSVHDTPAKLRLARQVVELLDHPRSVSQLQSASKVSDEVAIASFALRDTSACDAMRMLMSKIGIRAVACVEENETVLFRDTPEQVKAALDLLADFDRVVP